MRRSILLSAAVFSLTPLAAFSAPIVIQPTSATSNDTFIYSFLSTFNFNAPASGFDAILASGKGTNAHDLRSLLRFDLTGATLAAGEVATLNLYVTTGAGVGFPVKDPSAAESVVADVYALTSAFDASTATWGNQPSFDPAVIDSEVVDGVNRWVSFDVTPLVQSWLTAPASNFGFSVQQRNLVPSATGGAVQAVYHSSSNVNRPFLSIAPIPEPASAGLVLMGAAGMLRRRRSAK